MNGEIKIGIGDERETAQAFVETWRRTERNEAPEHPAEHLYFSDLDMLLRTLTPRRMALLKKLHAIGPVSVRALSKELKRDYKNVHTDIQILELVGLVTRKEDGHLWVPWERIIVEFRLVA